MIAEPTPQPRVYERIASCGIALKVRVSSVFLGGGNGGRVHIEARRAEVWSGWTLVCICCSFVASMWLYKTKSRESIGPAGPLPHHILHGESRVTTRQ